MSDACEADPWRSESCPRDNMPDGCAHTWADWNRCTLWTKLHLNAPQWGQACLEAWPLIASQLWSGCRCSPLVGTPKATEWRQGNYLPWATPGAWHRFFAKISSKMNMCLGQNIRRRLWQMTLEKHFRFAKACLRVLSRAWILSWWKKQNFYFVVSSYRKNSRKMVTVCLISWKKLEKSNKSWLSCWKISVVFFALILFWGIS